MLKLLRFMMVTVVLAVLALQPALGGLPAAGAANSVPATVLDGFAPNPDSIVDTILIQPDGKILIGGQFNQVGGKDHVGVARIYPDGSLDDSFNPATDLNDLAHPNYAINALALQKDGKILVGGQYGTLNGQAHPNLGRLNPDGSLDSSFNPAIDSSVEAVAVQPDGKILIAGYFQVVNSQLHPRIARLNADGSSDNSFIASASDVIYAMLLQPDGKILLGGRFGGVNSQGRPYFARLNADGTTDNYFGGAVSGNAFNGYVNSLGLQSDGKILVGGGINGYLLRFKPDGSPDTTFHPTLDASTVSIAIQPDGKIVISGAFTHINGQLHYHQGRINPDGTLDSSYNAASDGVAFTLAIQSNGGILLGGNFNNVDNDLISNPPNRPLMARLYPDGSLDDALSTEANQAAYALARQPDGKLLLGGSFTTLQASYSHLGLGRLDAGGTLDATYNASATGGATFQVFALGMQLDSKVITAGDFTTVDSVSHTRLARLKPDGTLDSAFNANPSANQTVYAIVLPQDGKAIIGGLFSSVNGTTRSHLARLTTSGMLDMAFPSALNPASANGLVNTLALQTDGKILVGGSFTLLDDLSHPNLGRLNADGSLDSAFAPIVDGSVSAVAVQHDGKIVIAGYFANVDSQPRARIARLNADGSLDASFNPGVSGGWIYSLVLQSDGRIIAGGSFTTIAHATHPYLARLNADGGLDSSFAAAPNALVRALLVLPDGKLLFSGDFTHVDGQPRSHLARVTLGWGGESSFSFGPGQGDLVWQESGPGPEPCWVTFEQSANGISFTPLGSATPGAAGWTWSGTAFPIGSQVYLRARAVYPGGSGNGSVSQILDTQLITIPDVTILPPPGPTPPPVASNAIYLPMLRRN